MGGSWKFNDIANVSQGTTRQALSAVITPNGRVRSITIQADDGNTDSIFVGGPTVASAGGRGIELTAGQAYTSPATDDGLDISTIFVVGGAAAQTLRLTYWEGGPYA